MSLSFAEISKDALKACENKNYELANQLFASLVSAFPNEHNGFYLYSKFSCYVANNVDFAIKMVKKAIELMPFFDYYSLLAECYLVKGDYDSSIKALKEALVYNPRDEKVSTYFSKLVPNNHFIKENSFKLDKFYENSKDCNQCNYKKIYDAGCIKRKAPKYIDEMLTENQRKLLIEACKKNEINNFSEGFVIKVNDGRALISQGCQTRIIASDGKYLKDMLHESIIETVPASFNKEVRVCDNLLVLSSSYGGNYYHWLTWTVPRIYMLEKAGYKIKDFDRIVINYHGYKFQKEFMEMLGIPREKIIATIPSTTMLRAKSLVTTSLPNFESTPEIVTKALREKLLSKIMYDGTFPKRIYLSRNKSKCRFVVNEDEVLNYLEPLGFKVIYAEEFSVSDQIKLFANADCIISQHGAGLTNIAFCNPDTKLIEIQNENFRKSYIDTAYFRLSADVGIDHYLMYGEPQSEGENANMIIDLDKLKATMNLADIN